MSVWSYCLLIILLICCFHSSSQQDLDTVISKLAQKVAESQVFLNQKMSNVSVHLHKHV